jgi:putative pyrroloquinoline-quinone binding quinoprotein
MVGGTGRNGAAAIDLSTGALLPWNPDVNPPPAGTPNVLALAADESAVYLEGLGPTLTAFDPATGVADEDFIPFTGPTTGPIALNGPVLCIPADGKINRLDRATGDLLWATPVESHVRAVAISPGLQTAFITDGNSVRGFEIASGTPRPWTIQTNDSVQALVTEGQRLYLGGAFGLVGQFNRRALAAVDFPSPETPVMTTWGPSIQGLAASVSSLAVRNSLVYAQGSFDRIGGLVRPLLAAIDSTGTTACAWIPSPAPIVSGLIRTATPELVITGGIVQTGGRTFPGLAVFAFAPCIADFSGDCLLNVNDFIGFQNAYASGDPAANCDGSTLPPILNVNDFLCFLTRFSQGCP